MISQSPQQLWEGFVSRVAIAPTPPANLAQATFDDVMDRITEFILRAPPERLRVIDTHGYALGLRALAGDAVAEFAQGQHPPSGRAPLSADDFAQAAERTALLIPEELLAVDCPETQEYLIGRFGANSPSSVLADIYFLAHHPTVREQLIQAMRSRLLEHPISSEERAQIIDFSAEVFDAGYRQGVDITAALSASALLGRHAPDRLPAAFKAAYNAVYNSNDSVQLEHFAEADRLGVARVIGSQLKASSLLHLVKGEESPAVLEVLLRICDVRWGDGTVSEHDVRGYLSPQCFWRDAADTMLNRLGLTRAEGEKRRDYLGADPQPREAAWHVYLRHLALAAMNES